MTDVYFTHLKLDFQTKANELNIYLFMLERFNQKLFILQLNGVILNLTDIFRQMLKVSLHMFQFKFLWIFQKDMGLIYITV